MMLQLSQARLIAPRPVPQSPAEAAKLASATSWLKRRQNHNTWKSYASGVKQFHLWLAQQGTPAGRWTAADVVLYIRHLLEVRQSAVSTVTGAVAALRSQFRYDAVRLAELQHRMVEDALLIAKRDGKKPVKKLPLTVRMLEAMAAWHRKQATTPLLYSKRTDDQSWTECRDVAMIVLMTAAFLRESEVTRLRHDDIVVRSATVGGRERQILEVMVRKAKNDQAGKGHLIRVGDQPVESTICPVFWVKLYRARMLAHHRGSGRLPTYFFHSYKGTSLRSTTPCGIVQRWVQRINSEHGNEFGDPKKYGSHSCRIGGVTAAHAQGVDMTLIQQHGGWKSDVVYDYIQPSQEQQLQVTQFMAAAATVTEATEERGEVEA
jgi:hypothetical protein